MRKIRVFIVAPKSWLAIDLEEILVLESFQVFYASDSSGIEIVQDVFMPDLVITFDTDPNDKLQVFDYFSTEKKLPVLVLTKRKDATDEQFLEDNPSNTIHFLLAYFMVETLLEKIHSLVAPIQADIDWINGISTNPQ